MRILIISAIFYPANTPRTFRTVELAKEFARKGNEVDVIIPENEYDYSYFEKSNSNIFIKKTPHLKWRKKDSQRSKVQHKISRLFQMFFEYPSIEWFIKMPKILHGKGGYDLLISIAVPHSIHWGIARCYKKGKIIARTWIADCGDPYMGCKTESYKKPFYFALLERMFCKQADYIAIPVESAKCGYYKEFWNKIRIIPQGINFDDIVLNNYIPNKPISFCFAGSFIPGIRDPRPILNALVKSEKNFRFYVFTQQKALLADFESSLSEKLIVKDYIPRLELIKFMSTMDFLLNIENGTAVQSPSKLIDYSLAKRPILSLDSQQLNEKKLNNFLNGDFSSQYEVGNIERYNIKNVVNKFLLLVSPSI